MKLPNNFGTVYQLSGIRRRPFVVKKTIDGKQKAIGYFPSYQEALTFLVHYNKSPNYYGPKISFEQVFNSFRDEHWPVLSEAGRNGYTSSYKHCGKLYSMPFQDLKLSDLQSVVNNLHAGYSTQKKVRTLFHMLFEYAMKNDIVEKDYSLYVTVCKDSKRKERKPFTVRQIRRLARSQICGYELILMLIYTGLRPSEFLRLKAQDINAKQRFLIVKQSKTIAGRNRIVPIHDCVWPFFEDRINNGMQKITMTQLRTSFSSVMENLHMKHVPYECRHTCATMLDNASANPVCIKKILGHAQQDVRTKFYTHKRLLDLRKAIALMPSCS